MKGNDKKEFQTCFRYALRSEISRQRRLGTIRQSEMDMLAYSRSGEYGSAHRLEYACYKLVHLLHKNTGRKVIVLVDEYDTPVASANNKEMYDYVSILPEQLSAQAQT